MLKKSDKKNTLLIFFLEQSKYTDIMKFSVFNWCDLMIILIKIECDSDIDKWDIKALCDMLQCVRVHEVSSVCNGVFA